MHQAKTTTEFDTTLKRQDLSLSFEEIGGYALPIVFYNVLLFTIIFSLFHGFYTIIFSWRLSILLIASLPVFLLGVVLHELIHGLCFALLSKNALSTVKYGFDKKTLTPYAHCKIPIVAWAYKTGALMPAILLGLIPFGISLVNGNVYLFFIGTFFTTAACGDFIVFWIIRKVNNKALVEDHPSQAGCYIHRQKDSPNYESFTTGNKSQKLHNTYRIPFLLLIAGAGFVLGFRLVQAIIASF